MIPQTIHQVHLDPLPEETARWVQTWKDKNPGWAHKLWQREEVASLPIFGDFVDWKPRAFMADLVRVEIIFHHGGFYTDADTIALLPLEDWACPDLVLCSEHGGRSIFNGFFGAEPKHPVIGVILGRLLETAHKVRAGVRGSPWLPALTGPHAWKRWLKEAGLSPVERVQIDYGGPLSHKVRTKDQRPPRLFHVAKNEWKGKPVQQ